MLAELAGLLAAPVRGAQEEGRLLGRVVIPIRLPLAGFAAQMRLDQFRADVETNDDLADPDVEGLADVPLGDGVEAALHLDVAIACDLGLCPGHDLERRRGQCQHGWLLERLEQQQWRRARRAMVSRTSDPQAPPLGTGVDLVQAAKRATRPETLPNVRNLPLDARFVFGFCGPGWVDQAAKMTGQLGVAAIEQRIVQVRVQDSAFEIVEDDPTRSGAKEGERPHVAVQP